MTKKNLVCKMGAWFKREKNETVILLRSIPSTVVSLFVVSVICMNLLARKTLVMTDWIALDAGILISWLSFLCMDIITKYFGPKASNKIAVLASAINLLTCIIFYIASIINSMRMTTPHLTACFREHGLSFLAALWHFLHLLL